jgi:hypothetical protein
MASNFPAHGLACLLFIAIAQSFTNDRHLDSSTRARLSIEPARAIGQYPQVSTNGNLIVSISILFKNM